MNMASPRKTKPDHARSMAKHLRHVDHPLSEPLRTVLAASVPPAEACSSQYFILLLGTHTQAVGTGLQSVSDDHKSPTIRYDLCRSPLSLRQSRLIQARGNFPSSDKGSSRGWRGVSLLLGGSCSGEFAGFSNSDTLPLSTF